MNRSLPEGTNLKDVEGYIPEHSYVDDADNPHPETCHIESRQPSKEESTEHMRRIDWAMQQIERIYK